MRILINDYSGHPFQVELSRELAARGHDVLHLYSSDFMTPRGDLLRHGEDPPSFSVEPVSTGKPFTKYNFLKRRGQDLAYAALVQDKISMFHPEIVVGCNNPLDAQRKIQAFCLRAKIRFVFWLQDIYSSAIKSILTQKFSLPGRLIGLWYEQMEKALLRRSHHVVPIADDFLPRLASWGVPRSKITVVENWASVVKIAPGERDNAWRSQNQLGDAYVLLYTGTIGLKHNPGLLLAAADAFRERQDVRLIVTSEGKYADELSLAAEQRGLANLKVLPFQPFETYAQVLAAGDILLAMIEPDAASYSVPSKVLSYLCSARPVVLSARADNLAARTLLRAEAGLVTEPQDEAGFITAIRRLLDDRAERERLGSAARRYAEAEFDIVAITGRFEAIFELIQPKA